MNPELTLSLLIKKMSLLSFIEYNVDNQWSLPTYKKSFFLTSPLLIHQETGVKIQ